MTLHDILSRHTFADVFRELCDVLPALADKRTELDEAYAYLLQQQPVASKKVITYELIDAQDSDDCFVGAEDRCFQANWNVVTGKEVVVDDDAEITPLNIAWNAFLCTLLLGFTPRRFQELCDDVRRMASGEETITDE